MIRKKAKQKTGKKVRKAAPKKGASKKKAKDAGQVREEIAGMVKQEARKITAAVVDKAKHGELAPVKYLFEVAKIYPQVEGEEAPQAEENFTKLLLERLDSPKKSEVDGAAEEKESSGEEKAEIAPGGKEERASVPGESSETPL